MSVFSTPQWGDVAVVLVVFFRDVCAGLVAIRLAHRLSGRITLRVGRSGGETPGRFTLSGQSQRIPPSYGEAQRLNEHRNIHDLYGVCVQRVI